MNVKKVELLQQEEDINLREKEQDQSSAYKDNFVLKTSAMFDQPPIP